MYQLLFFPKAKSKALNSNVKSEYFVLYYKEICFLIHDIYITSNLGCGNVNLEE